MTKTRTTKRKKTEEFDLKPEPRVLPMLGEINLPQWRCIAELVDNSVDGFLNESRSGNAVANARVDVYLPKATSSAELRIIDNGPGMTPDQLEKAVRAGWSGNNPIDNLGLFGMGFNVATARLGSVTEVWTTRRGESERHGIRIDFDKLRQQRHFRTPHLRGPKSDPEQHGTEIIIKKLKPEQRLWLSKSYNQLKVRKLLAQAYSSMLRPDGSPICFSLLVNRKRVEAQYHCVWDESRTTQRSGNYINAIINIDNPLTDRHYCINCMAWIDDDEIEGNACPRCSELDSIVKRNRKVYGWIGIQRYLHETEYGIDFIRNGRKIEIANKDLFYWTDLESTELETKQREYPIDDQRNRGRIVGEIHVDHCRVGFAKDHFDRTDSAWEDMIRIVRGAGPLRPEIAKENNYGPNDSPLGLLFSAFRRSSPQSKTAGAYRRLLLAKDNTKACDMAALFHKGEVEYKDDAKWWELVEAADNELLFGQSGTGDDTPTGDTDDLPVGLLGDAAGGSDSAESAEDSYKTPSPTRTEYSVLNGLYSHTNANCKWEVKAFKVDPDDPELPDGAPWTLIMGDIPTRTHYFLFNPQHKIFQSITIKPRDALLMQLSFMTAEQNHSNLTVDDIDFSEIFADFRSSYGDDFEFNPETLPSEALSVLGDIAIGLTSNCPDKEKESLYSSLSADEKKAVMSALASKNIQPKSVIGNGRFLALAPFTILQSKISERPDLCFDGKIWDTPYVNIDYQNSQISAETRERTLIYYLSLVSDAIWLSQQDVDSLTSSHRSEVIRAAMAIQILRPDTEIQI